MSAPDLRESGDEEREEGGNEDPKEEAEANDLERGEVGIKSKNATITDPPMQFHMSRMQRLSDTNPLRLVINGATRVPTASPAQPRVTPSQPRATPSPAQPLPTPTPQQSLTLNSRAYTNRISLFLFLLHMVVAIGLICFLVYKGVQGLIEAGPTQKKEKRVLEYFLPQVEAASLLSITLAFLWQKAVRVWPQIMVHFILWSSFVMSLSAGILLICFQKPPTDGIGILFISFAIGNGLYCCWVTHRIGFCCKVLVKSLEPVSKFPDLNQPTYWMLGAGFMWMSVWILAVIGSLNFYLPPLIVIVLVLSLMWTAEVMRNVANINALSKNLGSACLGSLFVPAIEALRIVARGLNLLEGEDEFMFSCAHCCLKVMDSIFRHGNGWAYVQIAAYGKGFVKASQDTWELIEKQECLKTIVDADMTSAICFLTGVCSGSMCVIVVAAWTARVHEDFTATISLLAFFIGYLMTRIAMALPHACVSCYYVCYAENPDNRLFDETIPDRLSMIKSGRDAVAPTPRVRRLST
ncbi:plasma-membrane choline transporter family protein [Actinidia rufa]|uniref:Choline transporter-like protein n=1 Tax=Actinidia rufa TaxID=165716 RepID=A0A7J0EW90_9ERIC|nr:plasma-membrane choline transporter family protein [Actinidia rufa]